MFIKNLWIKFRDVRYSIQTPHINVYILWFHYERAPILTRLYGRFIFILVTWYQSNRCKTGSIRRRIGAPRCTIPRAVIFLSRIIKPDDSIPRDIVCRVNITETLRGRRWAHVTPARCVCMAGSVLPIRVANFWVSIWRRVPIGRIDVVRGLSLAPLLDTSRTFAWTYEHNSSVLFARERGRGARTALRPYAVF